MFSQISTNVHATLTHVSNADSLRQTSDLQQSVTEASQETNTQSAVLETRLVLLLSFVSIKVCKPPDLPDNLLHSCNCKNNKQKATTLRVRHYLAVTAGCTTCSYI